MRFEKLPEEPAFLTFSTIGDAMNAEGYTGIASGDDVSRCTHCVIREYEALNDKKSTGSYLIETRGCKLW